MRTRTAAVAAIAAVSLAVFGGVTLAQQDRYLLKVPNGLAFSDFKGYDTWEVVAVSQTEGSVKAILGNPMTIRAYKEGIPDNGKPFSEGVKFTKIEWIKKKNLVSPYFVEIPDTLKTVSFIELSRRTLSDFRIRTDGHTPSSPKIPNPRHSSLP
jgi:hypothetical protein